MAIKLANVAISVAVLLCSPTVHKVEEHRKAEKSVGTHVAGKSHKAEKTHRRVHKAGPKMREYVDCEDVENNGPCVTFDDQPGGWVIIYQYEPTFKESKVLATCKTVHGGPVLPCVVKNRDKKTNKWIVFSAK